MSDKTYNVLFLCTGNSARSIMAEALVTTMGKGRFHGYSAGSHPGGTVNPFAIEQVKTTGYPMENLRSKSWDEFAAPGAPHMDFIITVCDNAAGEVCPYWPGHPLTAHWGFEDPAAAEGSNEEKRALFAKVFRQIMARVNLFVNLPLHMLEANAIQKEIKKIGETVPLTKLEVFDPAMCCPTGVCGVDVDPVLVQFNADLQWIGAQGIAVERHNLSQAPQAFAANAAVLKEMEAGMDRLPIIVIDGQIVSTGMYPPRAQLAQKLGIAPQKAVIKLSAAGAACDPKSGCC